MINALLKYQEVEANLISVEREIMQSDERKRVARAKNILNDVDANLAKMDGKAQELKAQYEKLAQKAEELAKQLKEYGGMAEKSKDVAEIDYLAKKMTKVDDDVNYCDREMQRIIAETRTHLQQYDDYRKKVKAAMEEYNTYKVKFDELKSAKKSEMDKVAQQLKKLEKDVEPELMAKYRKVREKKIYPALVPIKGDICTGCGMSLALAKLSKLSSDKVIECEECGRLLYKPE